MIVLKITDFPPFELTPFVASFARMSMCILHGVTIAQVEATPIKGFLKSEFVKPTALSIALLGALSAPSVTKVEYFFFVIILSFFQLPPSLQYSKKKIYSPAFYFDN